MSNEQSIIDANRAAQILNDPMIQAFFDDMQTKIFEAWTDTRNSQEDERERLWMMQQILQQFQGHFLNYMTNGRIELRRQERAESEGVNNASRTAEQPAH